MIPRRPEHPLKRRLQRNVLPSPHTLSPMLCRECRRPVCKDSGCNYCQTLQRYWHQAQKDHPEFSREHCILIGSFVAGMDEGFIRECGRGRMPTRLEMEWAVEIAGRYILEFGYMFRS